MATREGDRGWRGLTRGLSWFTDQVIKRDTWIVLAVMALTVFAAVLVPRLEYYDDITAFFPEDNTEVDLFLDVGKRFGGLDIALVGVETRDLFTRDNLELVRELSRKIEALEGVDSVVSVTEMRDFEEKQMGAETGSYIQELIGDLPDEMTAGELAAIRDRVMSREHIVGSLVSRDGRDALLVCRIAPGSNIKVVSDGIRQSAERLTSGMKGVRVYFGGAPLISSYIASNAKEDLTRLTPFVILAVILVVIVTLRSFPAAVLSLVTIGIGLVWTMGAMVLMGKDITLVTSSLPMILVALGSAYGIHLLARYFKILEDRGAGADRKDVLREMVRQVGIPVIMAGVTTMVGFASFLVFDIQPMREFGLLMAIGVVITLFVSLVFIPAVLSRFDFGRLRLGTQSVRVPEVLDRIASFAAARPVPVFVLFSVVMAASILGMTRITTQTSTRSYFSPDSEPILADDFLVTRFGGSLFINLFVEGDIRSPEVLREMEKLEDYVGGLRDVSDIQSATTIITMANAAMMGRRQIPETHEQVETLAFLAEDDPAVRLLVDEDWEGALVQIRIGGFDTKRADEIASELEKALDTVSSRTLVSLELSDVEAPEARKELRKLALADASRRIDYLLVRRGHAHVPAREIAAIVEEEWEKSSFLATRAFRDEVDAYLRLRILDDELVYLRDEDEWDELVDEVVGASVDRRVDEKELYTTLWDFADDEERALEREALEKRRTGEKKGPTGFSKAVRTIQQGVVDIQRRHLVVAILARVLEGGLPAEDTVERRILRDKTDQHLSFLFTGTVTLPEQSVGAGIRGARETRFDVRVTGYPLLYQQMNTSVWKNQIKSAVVALVIIFCLLGGLFWSVRIGVVAMVPSVTTLVVTFGVLGALGQSLDIGISMISIIALGVAVDYAIHFLWKYSEVASTGFRPALRETMYTTGRAVFANVFEVMFGFAILLFAGLVPIRKSGGLIAETLFLAGIGTLFLMPVFLRFAHEKVWGAGTRRARKAAGGDGKKTKEEE
jgi:predicted RND superfamily exporter protein